METQSHIRNKNELANQLDRPTDERKLHIGEALIKSGIITPTQLKEAANARATTFPRERIGKIIEKLGMATHQEVINALAVCLNIPRVNLNQFDIDPILVNAIPAEFSRTNTLIPIMRHRDHLVVAMEDPTDGETLSLLRFLSGQIIEPVISSAAEIDMALSRCLGPAEEEAILRDLENEAEPSYWEEQQAIKQAKDKPTVKLIHNLIVDAINRHASDIHIRPNENDVDIIFRIDGTLVPVRTVHKALLAAAVARIKIIAGANIAEHRLPQDGRTKIKIQDKVIDLRISVMPTIHGESVVMRVLDTSAGMKSISEIGFSKKDESTFRSLINKSSGLILVTGPTGSGKSTTLYSALQEIIKRNINIITVEDPVEYQINNILQIQIKPGIGYTFAEALKHILRHDPDAIMLGEIRDAETAKMAVESSLTGHLVLSTLHTNSAAATITRLLEIGIEPYLLNSTLLGVLAQRLVKRNCPHCLSPAIPPDYIKSELHLTDDMVFYKGKGCDHCHGLGYAGRIAVYELLPLSRTIRQLIKPGINDTALENAAVEEGMATLTANAIRLAQNKLTSIEEVYRVMIQ